jgi:WD40 repeat protein
MGSVNDGRRVRLWDVDEMVSSYGVDARVYKPSDENSFAPEIDTIGAAAVDKASEIVIVGSETGKIAAFDSATGTLRWVRPSKLQAVAVATAVLETRTVAVLASRGGLALFDLQTGAEIGSPFPAGRWIFSVATQVIDATPLCFVATQIEEQFYGVRVFDLRTCEEKFVNRQVLGERDQWLHMGGFKDKSLQNVCVTIDHAGEPIILMAGPYSFVRKFGWPPDLYRAVSLGMEEKYGNMYVHSLSAGKLGGKLVAAAGNERGLLAVWDLESNELLHQIEGAHKGSITALAIADWFGTGARISGGSGYVRVWSASLQPMLEIDFEERILSLAPLSGTRLLVATAKGVTAIEIRAHVSDVLTVGAL